MRTLSLTLLVMAAFTSFAVCAARPACADETDPFQMDNGHWMSFARFKDNLKNGRAATEEAAQAPAADTTAPAPTVIAAPTRPIDAPVLPGVSHGFSLQVDSTDDDKSASSSAQVVDAPDGSSDLRVQEQNWRDAAEAARQVADQARTATDDDAHAPIRIRMSYLPNPKIVPKETAITKHRPLMTDLPSTPRPVAAAPEPVKAAPAECAAVDQYKKRQLEAIQSDRKTLEALQTAIADLGLQKQLNFMTEGHVASVNSPAN